MNKVFKILSIMLLVIMMVSFATPCVFANDAGIISNMNSSAESNRDNDTSELTEKAGKIMATIRNIAVIAAVIIIMILGIKYMLGSVEEKAEYKKSFMPLIVGIVLVVAATAIASFIFGMVG